MDVCAEALYVEEYKQQLKANQEARKKGLFMCWSLQLPAIHVPHIFLCELNATHRKYVDAIQKIHRTYVCVSECMNIRMQATFDFFTKLAKIIEQKEEMLHFFKCDTY